MMTTSAKGIEPSSADTGASDDLHKALRHLEEALKLLDQCNAPKNAAAYIATAIDVLKED